MADIMTNGLAASPVQTYAVTPTQIKVSPSSEPEQEQTSIQRQEQLENVIAVSEDGDTLQVSDEAADERAGNISVSVTDNDLRPVSRPSVEENFNTAAPAEELSISAPAEKLSISAPSEELSISAPSEELSISAPAEELSISAPAEEPAFSAPAVKGSLDSATPAEGSLDSALTVDDSLPAASAAENRLDSASASEKEVPAAPAAERNPVSASAACENADSAERTVSRKETAVSVERNITSYAGYTDEQLEQMYLTGEISRYDYETEISSREEIREQSRSSASEASNQMTGIGNAQKDVERSGDAIQTAYSEKSNDAISAKVRMDALVQLQEATARDRDRELTVRNAETENLSITF